VTTNNPKRKNQKLQVIDLTKEIFEFSDRGFTISGFVAKDGKRWFAARIACEHLGLGNVSRAVSSLPYKDKVITITIRNSDKKPVQHLMVSLPGLFRLIFKSRKEEAVEYQDWIFDEVLPAIHSQGGYISPTATTQQIATLKKQLADSYQVNRWLGENQGIGKFIEESIPKKDR